jgi:hypothetical protein
VLLACGAVECLDKIQDSVASIAAAATVEDTSLGLLPSNALILAVLTGQADALKMVMDTCPAVATEKVQPSVLFASSCSTCMHAERESCLASRSRVITLNQS